MAEQELYSPDEIQPAPETYITEQFPIPGVTDESLSSDFVFNSKIELVNKDLDISSIFIPNFKKVARQDTLKGLTGVIGEWGIVERVHVLALEDDDSYLLLSGLRRLYGATRNNQRVIPSVVWRFSDPDEGKEKAMLVSLMLNRTQGFTPREVWEQMKILEEVHAATPGMIEFLLQLRPGEAMKLKDVMMADSEYGDIKADLLDNLLTIEGAYKKLTNARKKENRLEKEDATVLDSSNNDVSPIDVDSMPEDIILGEEEVKELLDLTKLEVTDSEVDDIENFGKGEFATEPPPTYDKDGNRTKLPDYLRDRIYQRDNFTCRCCGLGGANRLPTLQVHHIIEVSQGGDNSEENLITICLSCHTLIHALAWGKLTIRKEEIRDDERQTFKNIMKYANIIIKAEAKLKSKGGGTPKEEKTLPKFPMPGSNMQGLVKAYNQSQMEQAQTGTD